MKLRKRANDFGTRVRDGAAAPLVLAMNAGSRAVVRLSERPVPRPTAGQRLALIAVGAQLRAIAGTVLISTDSRAAETLEGALGALVSSTLGLIEGALKSPSELDAADTGVAPAGEHLAIPSRVTPPHA